MTPQIWQLKITVGICYPTRFLWGRNLGAASLGGPGLGFSEVVDGMSDRAAVVRRLTWGWKVCLQGSSIARLVVGSLSSSRGSVPEPPRHMVAGFPGGGSQSQSEEGRVLSFLTAPWKSLCAITHYPIWTELSPVQCEWGRLGCQGLRIALAMSEAGPHKQRLLPG